MRRYLAFSAVLLLPYALLSAQTVRPKDVREIAQAGSAAIPRLQELLKHPDRDVRLEAVEEITGIGTQRSLDPLVEATRDNDPEIQISAVNGIVNFYYPGYVASGFGGTFKQLGKVIKGRFTDTNDQAIDAYIVVRPDAVAALGKLASGGSTMQSRANAARAVGVLRGKEALPDLVEALRSKDSNVIYEAIVAIQKIGDQSAGPRIEFRLRDLDPTVQIAAINATGLLQNREALPTLIDVLGRADNAAVRRAALTAIAMMPAETSRPVYERYLRDKDERLRGAAAEGLGRLRNANDLPVLEKAWADEGKVSPRLSLAFAQVMLGKPGSGEFSPLQYLINNLNSASYSGEAYPFLVELAREEAVRAALYQAMPGGTRDEKIGIARVLARSGDKSSIPALEALSRDTNTDVAQEGLRALRTLQARM